MRRYSFDATDVKTEDVVTLDNITRYCNFGDLGQLNLDINRFNANHNTDLGYTKGFTFKPGTVDKISHIVSKYLFLIKTPNQRGKRTPMKIFDSIDNSRWRLNNVRDNFRELNRQLTNIRQIGLTFDNYRESLKEVPKQFIKFLAECNKILNPFGAKLSLKDLGENEDPFSGNAASDRSAFDNIVMLFEMELKKPIMQILGDNNSFLGEIEFPGDILLNIYSYIKDSIDLFGYQMTDRKVNGRYSMSTVHINGIHSAGKGLYHPFLGTNNDGHTCTGALQNDIVKAFRTFNMVELVTHIDTWLTTYRLGVTYPLNTPNTMFFGLPAKLTKELKDKIGQDTERCANRLLSRHELYVDAVKVCNDIECDLRDKCNPHNIWNDKDEQKKQVAQLKNLSRVRDWMDIVQEEYSDLDSDVNFDDNEDLWNYVWTTGEEHGLDGMRRVCDLEIVSPHVNRWIDLISGQDDIRTTADVTQMFGFHPDSPGPNNLSDNWDIHRPRTLYNFVWFKYLELGPDGLYDMFLEAMNYYSLYYDIQKTQAIAVEVNNLEMRRARRDCLTDAEEEMLNWVAAGGPSTTN